MEELERDKSWFARNWKWVVPTGGCLLVVIAAIVFAGSMIVGLSSLFEDSAPYKEALHIAQADSRVLEALGTPVEKSGTVKGSFTLDNSLGHANFEIPLAGPKGDGILYLDADRPDDKWVYRVLEVVVESTSDTIKLDPPGISR